MGRVLHASASGYFTECIGLWQKENPSSYPIDYSLELAMALFWRVRAWRFIGYITDTIRYPTHINKYTQEIFTPSSEEQLVCSGGFSSGSFTSGNPFESILFSSFDYDLGGGGIKKSNNQIFLPRIFFEGTYTGDTFSKQGVSLTNPGQASGSLTLSFLGSTQTIPLWRQADLVPPDPLAPYYENGDWEIQAAEYWSYGGTYDTTTGLPT